MRRLFIGDKNYSSWSLRPWVLMKALSFPFEECLVPFGTMDDRSAFTSFFPTGRVPCLFDAERTVRGSPAIAEYLAQRHRGVWPSDPGARVRARCVAAEMHSG